MTDREDVRLAVLETELRHIREGQEQAATTAQAERQAMREELAAMRGEVQKLKDVLTKASGMKLAFMLFVGGLGFIIAQFWNFMGLAK